MGMRMMFTVFLSVVLATTLVSFTSGRRDKASHQKRDCPVTGGPNPFHHCKIACMSTGTEEYCNCVYCKDCVNSNGEKPAC
uniref:A_Vc22.1 prepropeptide n=1 Tax=Conus victoriae TaxID=319920 RepID=W4VS22_CONVC